MYDSQPKDREGETIEEVLPAAIHTTSSTSRPPAPPKRTLGTDGVVRLVADQGRLVAGLALLCAVLAVLLIISLVL